MKYEVVKAYANSDEEIIVETYESELLARMMVEALKRENSKGALAFWVNETL